MATRYSRNSTDAFTQQRRREEQARQDMLQTTKYYAQTQAKADFELRTDNAQVKHRALQRFHELLAEHDRAEAEAAAQLEAERQEQSRIAAEEELAAAKLKAGETLEQRVVRMKARAKELKDKREAERLQIVDEKLKQKWRNDCDELRRARSERTAAQLGSFREAQLREHAARTAELMQHELRHAAAWEADRLRKLQREENESLERLEMEARTLAGLNEQVADLRMRRAREQEIKEQEAHLMREHETTLALEAAKARHEKEIAQTLMRKELDRVNGALMAQRARDIQASLALDLKIVTDILASGAREREEAAQRKSQYIADLHRYREFLQEQAELERERQREMERLFAVENERQWAQRIATWDREQQARSELLRQTIQGQKDQIQRKLAQNAREKATHDAESSAYAASLDLASLRKAGVEDREALQRRYADELRAQLQIVEARKRAEADELERDRAAMRAAEQLYQETLARELEALNKN